MPAATRLHSLTAIGLVSVHVQGLRVAQMTVSIWIRKTEWCLGRVAVGAPETGWWHCLGSDFHMPASAIASGSLDNCSFESSQTLAIAAERKRKAAGILRDSVADIFLFPVPWASFAIATRMTSQLDA
jgi:hypothetical protein